MAKTHNGAKKNNYDIQIDHNKLLSKVKSKTKTSPKTK